MRLKETKYGDWVLETKVPIESVTDHTGTTSFLYLTKHDLEELRNEIWVSQMEHDFKKGIL